MAKKKTTVVKSTRKANVPRKKIRKAVKAAKIRQAIKKLNMLGGVAVIGTELATRHVKKEQSGNIKFTPRKGLIPVASTPTEKMAFWPDHKNKQHKNDERMKTQKKQHGRAIARSSSNAQSKKRLEQVAERSLAIGNGFYELWKKTKDTGAGRLAISSYNTVNKATQTIIDLEQLPTKGHNKQVVTARKRVVKGKKSQISIRKPSKFKKKKSGKTAAKTNRPKKRTYADYGA